MVRNVLLACLVAVCAVICGLPATGHADDGLFPEYEVVKPNVSFWITIYTRYTTEQAVVHDSMDLDIVYDVIDLVPVDTQAARKINRERMIAAGKKYSQILKRLADDPTTPDTACRNVAALFGPGADAGVYQQASHQVRCQLGQSDRFQAGLVRSGAYVNQIRAILRSYGVPEDLAYLPHVESSFDIHAYSKFGAAGMWQFTRSTGKRFLTVNHIIDERCDPIAATHAAAQFLRENHEKLGTWPLAITAYNHGAAGMQLAKATHGDYPSIFSEYNGRAFKFASRNFYSEFLAARRIASQHQSYFGDIRLAEPIITQSIRLEGFVAFGELCHRLGFDPATVRAMNPALRPPVLSGQKLIPKHYRLNLPHTDEFDSGVSLASLLPDVYRTNQTPSQFYTVQGGDTAGKIARMHNVTLEDLVMANNLSSSATVYVHQRLRIPRPGTPTTSKEAVSPRSPEEAGAAMAAADAVQEAERILASVPVAGEGGRYRRPGPTPAEMLGMPSPEADAPLQLAAVQDSADPPTVVSAQVAFARIEPSPRQPVGIITVEVEETIGHYAEWAGVSASRIRRLNRIPFGKPLHLHQDIQIPLDNVTAEAFEARRQSFHEQLQRDFFAAYRVEELQQYRVKPGDSYWTLCREKFDLPLWLLQHYNKGVNLAVLKANQPLTIPAIQSIPQKPAVGYGPAASPDA